MRARFWIKSVELVVVGRKPDGSQARIANVTMGPVNRATEDNINWSAYTPSGEIKMTVSTEDGIQWWLDHQGQDCYVDLTPVPFDQQDVMDYQERTKLTQPSVP